MNFSQSEILSRIQVALQAARDIFARVTPATIQAEYKSRRDPVTDIDRELDNELRRNLLRDGEGWLSEETPDDGSRLSRRRVWIVDPLDGTSEFLAGIPEFSISVAMVDNGRPIAGGICNPASNEIFLGSLDSGLLYNGKPARPRTTSTLQGALVLASRSEVERGEWKQFENAGFQIRPMGSVAYKLACVSAGLADATFTLTPKHEWDVAAGAVLVESAGGFLATLENAALRCNNRNPLLSGLIAAAPGLRHQLCSLLSHHTQPRANAPS